MQGDRRAPDEPVFPGLEASAPVSLNLAERPESAQQWGHFDAPVDESPDLEPGTTNADGSSPQYAIARPLHPALARVEELLTQGQPHTAARGFELLATATGRIAMPSLDEELVWLTVTRRAFETTVQLDEATHATKVLRDSLPHLRSKFWSDRHARTQEYFAYPIRLALKFKRIQEALDIYARIGRRLQLDAPLRKQLIDGARVLGQVNLAVARLCLEGLESGQFQILEQQAVLTTVRQALRVDLTSPSDERLIEVRALNERVQQIEEQSWARVNLAVVALREGRIGDALKMCHLVQQIEAGDASTREMLAIVLYCGDRWDTSIAQFDEASAIAVEKSDRRLELLRRLCRINLLLEIREQLADRSEFLQRLGSEWTKGRLELTNTVWDLNATWVFGTVLYLLGRDHDAVQMFQQAPPKYVTWPHALGAIRAHIRAGLQGLVPRFLRALAEARPDAVMLVRLLDAQIALDDMRWDDAQEFLHAADHNDTEFLGSGADLATVRDGLHAQLLMSRSEGLSEWSLDVTENRNVSAAVRATVDRLRCVWHLERGEFQAATAILGQPLQWVAPETESRRLEGIHRAFLNDGGEVTERLFEHLASVPAAQLIDRLHWGLWLCNRGDYQRALAVLQTCPDCLESQLARAECHLGQEEIELTREILEAMAVVAPWRVERRTLSWRPWARRLPPETWRICGSVSAQRICDMLHAAHLMVRSGQIELALETIDVAEQLLGAQHFTPQAIGPHVGQIVLEAAWTRLDAATESGTEAVDTACRLHRRSVSLGAADPEFAIKLADATTGFEFASDLVLDELCSWSGTPAPEGTEAANDSVLWALERLLFINEEGPDSPEELDRRVQFSERLQKKWPEWDWPWRNLARAAQRQGNFNRVLECLDQLRVPVADDHRLRGHVCWAQRRFDAAVESFVAAREMAWAGCARGAALFDRLQDNELTEDETQRLLEELDWTNCDQQQAPLVRVWRAAVLVAARRGAEALDSLDFDLPALDEPTLDEETQAAIPVLKALAWLLCGQQQAAHQLLASTDPVDTPVLRRHAVLRLLSALHRASDQELQEIAGEARQLRQRGEASQGFHLLETEIALSRGRILQARESADAARAAVETDENKSLLLAPLRWALQTEQVFVDARLMMHDGRFDQAADRFAQCRTRRIWPGSEDYWRALCLVQSGRVDEGQTELLRLSEEDVHAGPAHTQLALILLRNGQSGEAQQHLSRALELVPDDPFALLAQAQIAEASGKSGPARAAFEAVAQLDPEQVGPRAVTAALLALGRLEEASRKHRDAAEFYRRALSLQPESVVAQCRLGLLLAVHGTNKTEWSEAHDNLAKATAAGLPRVQVWLGQALVALRLQRPDVEADCLNRLISHDQFAELPAGVRARVALWAAEILIRQRRYEAAAEAFERLIADDPSASAKASLAQCKLLQAAQLLNERPFPPEGLQRMLKAAEAVCEHGGKAPDPIAVLLRLLCRVLLNQISTTERDAIVVDVRKVVEKSPQLRELGCIILHLLESIPSEFMQDWTEGLKSASDELGRNLDLLRANLKRDTKLLRAEVDRLLESNGHSQGPGAPFRHEDLVLVCALSAVAGKKLDQGCELVRTWHRSHAGDRRTWTLQSKLLVRRAARSIKSKNLGEASRFLCEAMSALSTADNHNGNR